MQTYQSKAEFIQTIQTVFQRYIAELEAILERLNAKRIAEVDRTPSENLSYQLAWLILLNQWATTSANWVLWKWIHINSVVPLTSFRTKIRKGKK